MNILLISVLFLLSGCDHSKEKNPSSQEITIDQDADGWMISDGDCDDKDPEIHPEAEEIWYDGIDQNCDNSDDFDQDFDGHTVDNDCDDTDPLISPGAEEIWYDSVDQNCDGANDFDQDGDGFIQSND